MMKYLILLLFFCGCVANKTVTRSSVKDSTVTNIEGAYHYKIDTSLLENKNIQVVEVLYSDHITGSSLANSVLIGGQRYTGNIISAKTTTYSENRIKKGITEIDSTLNKNIKQVKKTNTEASKEPGQSPYKWLFIAISILGALGIIVFSYYKLKPILTALKPLDYLKNLFK